MAEPENMFDSVTQRFEESMESLERLRSQLDGLASAEEHQAQVSESIAGAATQMHQMARSLGAATETAQSAMEGLQSTLLAANQLALRVFVGLRVAGTGWVIMSRGCRGLRSCVGW